LGRAICVPQREFEDLMVEVADNSIMRKSALRDLTKKRLSHPELRYLGRYLEKSSRKTAKLRKTIKFRELRQIVESNGFKFSNAHKGTIDIMKVERRVIHRFWRKDRIEDVQTKVGQVAYHGEGVDVPDNTLREVRRVCGLTEQDGYDGDVLLRDAQPTFQLIKSYRTSLQNLAYR
jgi:death-on-curing protein